MEHYELITDGRDYKIVPIKSANNRKKKIIAGVVCVLLAAVVACVIGWGTRDAENVWFKEKDHTKWFQQSNTAENTSAVQPYTYIPSGDGEGSDKDDSKYYRCGKVTYENRYADYAGCNSYSEYWDVHYDSYPDFPATKNPNTLAPVWCSDTDYNGFTYRLAIPYGCSYTLKSGNNKSFNFTYYEGTNNDGYNQTVFSFEIFYGDTGVGYYTEQKIVNSSVSSGFIIEITETNLCFYACDHILLNTNFASGEKYYSGVDGYFQDGRENFYSSTSPLYKYFYNFLFTSGGVSITNFSGDYYAICPMFFEFMTFAKPCAVGLRIPELPPEKEGYVGSWYMDSAYTVPYNGTTPICEHINLYAKYEVKTLNVTFDFGFDLGVDYSPDVNEYEGYFNGVNVTYGDALTFLPKPLVVREGYDFVGWMLNGELYDGQPIKDEVKLTAYWQIKTFTVTFYVDGAVYTTKEVEYGTVFAEVVEEVKLENLQCLSIIDGVDEKDIEEYLNTAITDDYSVKALKISIDPESALLTIKEYKDLIIVCAAIGFIALAGVILIINGLVGGRKNESDKN